MDSCRLCGKNRLTTLLDMGEHSIAHRFLECQSQKEYVHPVVLCFCDNCGFIQLDNPIPPDLLYTNYVCLSSWKHQPHIPKLVKMITGLSGVRKDSMILEVGSNDGIFLTALFKEGYKNIIGIEPACDAKAAAQDKGVKTISAYFNCKTAEEFVASYGKCDLFISRQVIEHISDLQGFREAMRTVISPGAFVLFELPDFTASLDMYDYSIWEEHVNYFTLETLTQFLLSSGIRIIHSETVNFSGSALVVMGEYTGKPLSQPPSDYMKRMQDKVIKYAHHWPEFRNDFIEYLKKHKRNGGKVAIYGAGSRACSLINFIGLAPYIEFVVDDQPEKQKKYMPGSRLQILPGNALNERGIDLCLLAVNYECEDVVIAKNADFIKKGGSFVSMLVPSKRLPPFWNGV
jgi:2-polyprenyl-3-methyl-5-hydroxy-6-metoxy-1,4-benzoquinol methylase